MFRLVILVVVIIAILLLVLPSLESTKKIMDNYKHIYEFLTLIFGAFLGIFLAIQAENYRISKDNAQQEKEALNLLSVAVKENSRITKDFIGYLEKERDSLSLLLEHIENKKPYDKILNNYFTIPGDNFTSLLSTSAFENLKAQGIGIIKSDTLTTKLFAVFGQNFDLIKDQEKKLISLYPTFQKFKFKHFKTVGTGGQFPVEPINYDNLINDPEFIGLYTFYVQAIQSLINDHEKLKKNIDGLDSLNTFYINRKYPK